MIEIIESVGRFKRAVNLLVVQELKPLGFGSKQASVLRYLAAHRSCSHADLARHTITDPAAAGRIVDALIRRGLIARKEHPSDRRRWMLSLSPQGLRAAERIAAVFKRVAGDLAAPLNSRERLALVASLDKITASLSPGKPPTKARKGRP
ncbi:MAG TPA: MarR family transcriptional regulator [bacterium]|jgi:DNA-binding MarR family transcriptional regulator|nr:MarR family transcriptional regulator [bacterium]